MTSTPAAGENIAVLRKVRGVGQTRLAREAGVSVSLLRKIEQGTRAATPPTVAALAVAALALAVAALAVAVAVALAVVVVAAALALAVATAQHVSTARVYGSLFPEAEQSDLLDALRGAVHRHILPKEAQAPFATTTTRSRSRRWAPCTCAGSSSPPGTGMRTPPTTT